MMDPRNWARSACRTGSGSVRCQSMDVPIGTEDKGEIISKGLVLLLEIHNLGVVNIWGVTAQ